MAGSMDLKAWQEVIWFPLPGRTGKPRRDGLTMVIDKGLGLGETKDLFELAGEYIDFVKLAFGTSVFYPPALLKEKISLATSYGIDIYPGGTFLEVAACQGKLDQFLDRAKELGFTAIEISNGAVPMTADFRAKAIDKALCLGFRVLTEVGRKDPREKLSTNRLLAEIKDDLACGASLVIVEGRETGKGIGFYDQEGKIIRSQFEDILAGISDPRLIIWEAPLKNQQAELIRHLGPNVNLGNVQPSDLLALEALRSGLRADTLKFSLAEQKVVSFFERDSQASGIS